MKQHTPFIIGLTGSIGMGKSTTAKMFRAEGIPVWDADAVVARLYGQGGQAVPAIARLCPGAVRDEAVSKEQLRDWIAKDTTALRQIEKVVHPLVANNRAGFIADANADIIVLDIPLLFETGGEAGVDMTVVVTASAAIQQERVLARPRVTRAQFEQIKSKQMQDGEKRKRADHVIITETLAGARHAVQTLIGQIREQRANA